MFELPDAEANLFRYAHLVFVALTFGGIALLMRELYRPIWLLGLSLATLCLAVSTLSVAASVLIDYNGALAMCVVVWLTWAFVRADREPRYLPLVGVLLALTFSVGLGVGAAAVLGLLLWTLLFHRSAFIRDALALAAGLVLFLVAFWLFSLAGHFPFSQPFLHNFQRAALQTPVSSRLVAVFKYLRWYVERIGSVAIVIALLLAARRLVQVQTRHSGQAKHHPLEETRRLLTPTLVLVALLSQASLSGDAYGFPKYIAFALPLLFAFIGGEVAELAQGRRARWLAATLASLLVISLVLPTAQALRRPGGTLYMAGEQGFAQAAQALADNSQPSEIILGSKDLSFYAERKFVQWSEPLWTDPRQLVERVRAEDIRLAGASQGQLATASPELAAWLADHAVLIASPGDNRVYSLR